MLDFIRRATHHTEVSQVCQLRRVDVASNPEFVHILAP